MRRVGDHHQKFGSRFVSEPTERNVARDRLVERGGFQTVSARQIEHAYRTSVGQAEVPFLAFDGDTGVVRDFLTTTRHSIEQRRLTAIG